MRRWRALPALALAAMLGACGWVPVTEEPAATGPLAPDPDAPRLAPVATRHFEHVGTADEVLGEVQIVFARHENTLVDFARRYNLGFDELQQANPGVDAWLPGEGTPIYLPTMLVIPDAPREGLVLNLPSMRLLYFVPETAAAETPAWSVTSHPIGIGREGWATPTGQARVISKALEPTWYPPASVRAEHAELGDPLPAIVPPGPDNPLGRHALGLSLPGYLIHGTNKPPGVGMRVSHGCVRLYPEDIEALYDHVGLGTPVHIVDQPVLAGWRDGVLYLEVHPPLSEDPRDLAAEANRVVDAALQRAGRPDAVVDPDAVARIVAERSGIPLPVLHGEPTPERFLAAARVIENDLPVETAGPDTVTHDAARTEGG
ncbi:MAG: L,D-transpeptidase family protein [Xanthomonadales bacterium]|nr:L,D-transpeptidase family protein [Xanthomonadales bacterium]